MPKRQGISFRSLEALESCFWRNSNTEAERMAKGVRKVDLIGRVKQAGRDQVRLDWRFRAGRQWLDADEAQKLVRWAKVRMSLKALGWFG